ncbi:hypothetical protein A2291_06215 [candidate division WOR-1 bacterium RIFOXYB2_FULL_42_35]|nr:MAG: hypothetical protein A2247_07855 [candidate division WOR-1 bacterium RIFOXYA2_FULL_41_14]OGC21616.1 MAG: hypothetical protein A2291_06215 [candidate division WOR-1 bacterium RIFOXYB2_FULL_42_35]
MESVASAIVILFVITILTSVGGRSGPQPQFSPKKDVVYHQPAYEELPRASFSFSRMEQDRESIGKFIVQYRSPEEAVAITNNIIKYGQEFDVDPKLVAALMSRESRFNPKAVSISGAMGLGQLMPSTCSTVGISVADGFDIEQNTKGTTRYLKYLLDKFKESNQQVAFAIAGYLEGPNAVARKDAYTSHTKGYLEDILAVYNKL